MVYTGKNKLIIYGITLGFTKYVQAKIIYQYTKENLEYSMIVYSQDYLLL